MYKGRDPVQAGTETNKKKKKNNKKTGTKKKFSKFSQIENQRPFF